MTEHISREAAIDDLTHTLFYDQRDKATAKKVIATLLAADVKPVVRGEWKQTGDHSAICTACGKTTFVGGVDRTGQALIHKGLFQFCPKCGADMRGNNNEQV